MPESDSHDEPEPRGLVLGSLRSVKASAQLPLVDRDFRFVERRPERLHAYARGLLQHLRGIRAGGKAEGYPISTIKAATVWLIESYAEALVAPAPEAAVLVSEIVRPHRNASTLPVRRSIGRLLSSRPIILPIPQAKNRPWQNATLWRNTF